MATSESFKSNIELISNEYKNIKGWEKQYVHSFGFRTQGSNDIDMKLIKKLLNSIDRKEAIRMINKYIEYEHLSEQIEFGIFEFALVNTTINSYSHNLVSQIYIDKVFDICANLDINNERINNQILLPSILNKSLNSYNVAFLPPEQLNPMKFKKILDRNMLRDNTLNDFETTDMYKCKKCGERKFKISTMQTRCADEPETKFLTCLVCYMTFTI